MINSGYDIRDLHEIQEVAGPNPNESKLTGDERIHLIYMVGAMNRAILEGNEELSSKWRHKVRRALTNRGMKTYHIAEVLDDADLGDAVGVVDLISVHHALRSM